MASRNPVDARNHVACSSLEPEKSRASNNSCRERIRICPSSMSCPCCNIIHSTFLQQSSSYRSPVLKKGPTCRFQTADSCDRPILFTVSIFAKGQIHEECVLRNVES